MEQASTSLKDYRDRFASSTSTAPGAIFASTNTRRSERVQDAAGHMIDTQRPPVPWRNAGPSPSSSELHKGVLENSSACQWHMVTAALPAVYRSIAFLSGCHRNRHLTMSSFLVCLQTAPIPEHAAHGAGAVEGADGPRI